MRIRWSYKISNKKFNCTRNAVLSRSGSGLAIILIRRFRWIWFHHVFVFRRTRQYTCLWVNTEILYCGKEEKSRPRCCCSLGLFIYWVPSIPSSKIRNRESSFKQTWELTYCSSYAHQVRKLAIQLLRLLALGGLHFRIKELCEVLERLR
jgi:hypothetical protein